MPLYQGGAVDSRIRQAQHNFRQAQQNYDYQERLIESQVRNAFRTIEASINQVQAQQRALTAAQTAAEATQTGFEVGTRTAVDVLTTLRDVFAARRNYSDARYNYLLSTLQLRNAAGSLEESDLRELDQILTQPAVTTPAIRTALGTGTGIGSSMIVNGGNAQDWRARKREAQLQAQRRQQELREAKLEAQRRQQQHEARLREQRQQQQNEARRRALQLQAQRNGQPLPVAVTDPVQTDLSNSVIDQNVQSTSPGTTAPAPRRSSGDFVFIE
ncbi:MAG: TolC family protein [Thiolinea sp.]